MKTLFKILKLCVLLFLLSGIVFASSQQKSNTPASIIITNARSYLNETTEQFWLTDELLTWLNDGVLDIVLRTRCLETSEDITLIAGQLEYDIRTDYLGIESIYYHPSGEYKGLKMIEPKDVGHIEDIGEPDEWYEWEGKVGFSPLVLEDSSGGAVTLYLILKPETVTLTDKITIPAIYDRALTLYIVSKGHLKERRIDKAAQLMAEYVSELDRFRLDFTQKPKED
jgi:hypothetical protein